MKKSFRPITLSSHLVKTFEKLILFEVTEMTMRINPLHKRQNAFTKGKSKGINLTGEMRLDIIKALQSFKSF